MAVERRMRAKGDKIKLKIGLTIMLLAGTNALAQQTNNPTAPTNPAAPHTDPIQNQVECWDATANRVRNSAFDRPASDRGHPASLDQRREDRGQNPAAAASEPQNQEAPGDASTAKVRPPGMKNC